MTTVTAQPTLDEQMSERAVPPAARAAIHEAVETVTGRGMSVEARASRAHISLLVTGQPVAVFIHPRRFNLTFDKAVATDLAERYEICELQNETNKKTGHVSVGFERLRDARWTAIVTGLLVEALERSLPREPGARRPKRAVAPTLTPVAQQCPVHQQAMFGGSCYLCD